MLVPVALRDGGLVLDRLEDEVRGVDLTVRMRIRDAHHLALVLEHQDMVDLRPRAEIAILLLPGRQQSHDQVALQLRQRHIVPRGVTDHCATPPADRLR